MALVFSTRANVLIALLLASYCSIFWKLLSTNSVECESMFPRRETHVSDVPQLRNENQSMKQSTGVSTSLAYTQSYGVFNDITDDSWKLMQQRANSFVQYSDPAWPETGYGDPVMWYLNNLQPELTCPHTNRVGGHGDGPKWTCDPHRLLDRKDCLIYSIGSEGKYEWEEALIDLLGSAHCEIHVFDPGNYARPGDPENNNIHYHSWGLKSSYDHGYNAEISNNALDGEAPDMLSFQRTMDKLGHQGRTLDILKIDCEKCEWANYKDWISADIRQILIETHGVPSPFDRSEWHHEPMMVSEFFDAFTDNNFAMFSKEVNVYGGGNCIEFSYIKLHPDFWGSRNATKGRRGAPTRDIKTEMRPVTISDDSLPDVVVPDPRPTSFKIPHRLIFAYETNIIEMEEPVMLYLNVKRIIDRYREAWGEPMAPAWFLNHITCMAAIKKAKPELLPAFRAERAASKKLDMCRVAALYLSGGYCFDVDLEVGPAYTPADDVSLVVARDGDHLSNKFLASEAKSSVMLTILDKMADLYKRNQTGPDFELGSETLTAAFSTLGSPVQSVVVPLENIGEESILSLLSEPTVESFDNPVPIAIRDIPTSDFKIPHRLIFTYKHNLLETKAPLKLYENVQTTIRKYREAWGEHDAPVWFLNDTDCRSAIYATQPKLLPYFDREVHGSWKADICRVAALYLTGGYYFDVDMETVKPWTPNRTAAFVTVIDPKKSRYFQSFVASEQKGRILDEALKQMLLFYENRKPRVKALLGPDTMLWAFESLLPSERGETVILEEVEFPLNQSESPLRRDAVGCCKSD
jgi:mannosyltransferase OCH1-like enzyme